MASRRIESFRTYVLRGLLAFLPLAATLWVLHAVIRAMDRAAYFLPPVLHPNRYLPVEFPGVGAITTIAMLWLIGFIVTHFISQKLRKAWDQAMRRIPLVRGIYSAIAQLADAIFSEDSGKFRRVVMIEYPRKGLFTLGLVTGETEGEVRTHTSEPVLNVFVPTTPNPTSGWYVVVPKAEAVNLKMTVEQAFKLIISGGIVTPDAEDAPPGAVAGDLPAAVHPRRRSTD